MYDQPSTLPGARGVLLLDAAASGAMGALLAALAPPLSELFGLPAGLLRGAGLALLPFAACLVLLARRDRPSAQGMRTVVGCNALWVAASLLLLVSGRVEPTTLGAAFVLAQAAAVVLFSVLEVGVLRRPRAALAAHG